MHREYSRAKEGLVSVIIDSYDKAKLSLPRFPFGRVPKKSIYEETRRAWASSSFLLNFKLWQKFYLCCCLFYHMVYFCCFEVFFWKKTRYLPDVNGSYLPWLGLLHVSFFRSTERRIKLELGVCSSPLFECFGMSMRWIRFFGKFLFCDSFPRIKGTTVFGPCLCPSYGVESHIPLWAAWWKFKTCQSELFVSFREGFHVPTRFQLQSDNTVKDSCMQKHFFGWEGGLMCLIMDCICIIKNGLVLSWKDVSEHPRKFETGMQADWWWHCAKTVYSRFAITATCQWVTPMRTWMLCCR